MTYTFEAAKILPVFYSWLKSQSGVDFVQKKVDKLDGFDGFDFVVNCSGIGAKDLVIQISTNINKYPLA